MNALTIVLAVLSFLVTATGAVAAVGSWRSSRNSERAAMILAEIERNRWHTELTPQFDITCYRRVDSPAVILRLTFIGPDGLDCLDSVEVTIRDDRRLTPSPIANGPSAEDLANVIWGPLRFVPGVNGADRLGRAVPAFPMDRQETVPRAMEDSFPPRWNPDPSAWRRDQAGHPLRLTMTCTREGYQPWTVTRDVPVELERDSAPPAVAPAAPQPAIEQSGS